MSKRKIAAIVLAAGLGTRMKSDLPKVMHQIAGRPMINHLLATLDKIHTETSVVVIGPEMEALAKVVAPHPTVVQYDRRGTGDAVKAALPALDGFKGDVLIVYGDTPLISEQTLNAMLEARQTAPSPAVVVLGFEPDDPGEYGRLVLDEEDGSLIGIIEARDASPEERENGLCNSGVMAVDGDLLAGLLNELNDDNAKGEYYLTDIVGFARDQGFSCAVVEGDEEELIGVNSRIDLAMVETVLQDRLRDKVLRGGATLIDPSSVYLSFDTQIGQDVIVEPNVFFGPGVEVGGGVHIKAFCHFEGAVLADHAIVGPFARLRPGAEVGEAARVGNFCEIKNAQLESGAKVNHLTYIGDATVGAGANIGAGTITCNYDGFLKSRTEIGAGAFIGSNTALVAPVKIGAGAIVGAGSTLTSDVAADALTVARASAKTLQGGAANYRARKQAEKDSQKKD